MNRSTRPATDPQVDLIRRLASERPDWQQRLSGTAYERTFDVTTGSGKFLSSAEASVAIKALLDIPKPDARRGAPARPVRPTSKTTFRDALAAMRGTVPTPPTPVTPLTPASPDSASEEEVPAILDQDWAEGDVLRDQTGRLWVLLRISVAPLPKGGLDLVVMGASGADRARKCTLRIPNRVIRAEKVEGPDAEWARELARDAWRAGARW